MENNKKTWFKEHADTIAIITLLLAGFYWADGKFEKVNDRFAQADLRFTQIEKDVTAIKTIMIMKNVMTTDLAKCDKDKKD